MFNSVVASNRIFNEIVWNKTDIDIGRHAGTIVCIFEMFGQRIDKLSINALLNTKDLRKLLRFMPNLVELDLDRCSLNTPECLQNIIQENSSQIQFGKLKKLSIASAFLWCLKPEGFEIMQV